MERYIEQLKSKGLKVTPQRLAIFEFLETNRIHPSAEKIFEYLKLRFPTISLATVYNTLKLMRNNGFIRELQIKPDRKNYDIDISPHHHFFCRNCFNISDVPGDSIDLRDRDFERTDENRVEKYEIYFYGVCKECMKNEELVGTE